MKYAFEKPWEQRNARKGEDGGKGRKGGGKGEGGGEGGGSGGGKGGGDGGKRGGTASHMQGLIPPMSKVAARLAMEHMYDHHGLGPMTSHGEGNAKSSRPQRPTAESYQEAGPTYQAAVNGLQADPATREVIRCHDNFWGYGPEQRRGPDQVPGANANVSSSMRMFQSPPPPPPPPTPIGPQDHREFPTLTEHD